MSSKNRSHGHKQAPPVMGQKQLDRPPTKASIALSKFTSDAIPVFSKVDPTFANRLLALVQSLPQKVTNFAQRRIQLPPKLSPASMLVAILNWLPSKMLSVVNSLRKEAEKYLKLPVLLETELKLV